MITSVIAMLAQAAQPLPADDSTASWSTPPPYLACVEEWGDKNRRRAKVRYSDEIFAGALANCSEFLIDSAVDLNDIEKSRRTSVIYSDTYAVLRAIPRLPAPEGGPFITAVPNQSSINASQPSKPTLDPFMQQDLGVVYSPAIHCIAIELAKISEMLPSSQDRIEKSRELFAQAKDTCDPVYTIVRQAAHGTLEYADAIDDVEDRDHLLGKFEPTLWGLVIAGHMRRQGASLGDALKSAVEERQASQ